MVKYYCIFIWALFCFALDGAAQDDINFTASVNKNNVAVDERVQLTFELNSRGSRFRAPDLGSEFKVYSGPNQSTSMAYVNGQLSQSMSFSYVLQPRKTGKLTIKPATIQVDGETYQSNPITITVTKAGAQAGGKAQPKKSAQTDNIFIAAIVNKKSAYQGEQLFATYKLYTAYPVRGSDRQKLPDLTGFYSSNIEFEQNRPHVEVVNGKRYDVYDLRKYVLFAQRSGELTVDAIEFDLTIQVKDDEPIETFFGPRYRMIDKKITLKSKPITVNIKPLPKPQPASFSGAVGKFDFSASLDRSEVETNESVTLNYKISGAGNINLVDHPTHTLPVEFEVYDPKINTSKNQKSKVLTGTKTWEYLMIPRTPGEYEIEVPAFSYFDPAKEQYVESSPVKKFPLAVTGDPMGTEAGVSAQKREVQQLDSDIRFIKTDAHTLKRQGDSPFKNIFMWLFYVVPGVASVALILVFRRRKELRADVKAYRRHKATKVAAKSLSKAKQLLKEDNKNAFYEEIYRAINDYLSNKLTISRSNLTLDHVSSELKSKNVDEEVFNNVKEIIETCEMARFAPIPPTAGPELLQKAEDVIKQIESAVK